MKVRFAGMIPNSLVNGEGMRAVLFAQGCKHNCKGCFNPETHDFNGGEEKDCNELVRKIVKDPIIHGVTFSGGDPFYQADKFAYMARRIKSQRPELNIWTYTGFTFEELLEKSKTDIDVYDLLHSIDVLVDGMFDETKKDNNLKFRGSSNQRIIFVPLSLCGKRAMELISIYK